MSHTDDYEHLLELDEVIGIEFDEEDDEIKVLVRQKLPEDELDEDQIVANNVQQNSDVLEIGQPTLEDVRQNLSHRKRKRPAKGGLSEGPDSSYSAGTAGPLARVTDPDSEYWADDVSEEDLVRLSNNHVYAGASHVAGYFEADILQPGQLDQGGPSDKVGSVVGYVPFDDGITVDCAARSVDEGEEERTFVDLEDVGDEVLREGYADLKGESVTKSGRTTGVTEAEVIATSATIRVQMSGDSDDVVTFRDQLVTNDMSDGGDSGSAVFDSEGRLVGLLFAGSSSATILNKIANVEGVFGVRFAPFAEDDEGTEGEDPSRVLSIRPARQSSRTFVFSFDISEDTDVEVLGGTNSTEIVGNRINGYISTWANEYVIRGEVTEQAIPERARVSLDDEEIDPSDLPDAFDNDE